MTLIDDDDRWDTFGLLMEAYRAIDAAIECDTYDAIEYDRQVVDLLIRLARTPDGQLRPSQIATALATSRSHATTLIDRAETAGLVRRIADADDRRSTYVTLTPEGQREARAMTASLLDSVQSHIHNQLEPHQITTLDNTLRTLRDAAQSHLRQQYGE